MNKEQSGKNLGHRDEYWAYVSAERLSGKCALLIFGERNSSRKEYDVYSFLLSFNHEGIKEYHKQNLIHLNTYSWQEEINGYVRIDFGEAVALLQDAYWQNCLFGTKPARGWADYRFFLEYDPDGLDQALLMRKFSLHKLTPEGFTNIYLYALKQLDYALLYDLCSRERKAALGSREAFPATISEDWWQHTIIKCQFEKEERNGRQIITTAYAIVYTAEEEIMKIEFRLVLREEKDGCLALDDFQELKRTVLSAEHPENPLNYRVFCSVYSLTNAVCFRNWLQNRSDVFLTGEFEAGACYKLLQAEHNPLEGYDVKAGIVCEFILKDKELIVYAPWAVNLAKMERALVTEIKKGLAYKQKYYLPVRELYKAVLTEHSLEEILREPAGEDFARKYQLVSAISCTKNKGYVVDLLRKKASARTKLDQDTWYFVREKYDESRTQVVSFIEYYVVGNWVRINAFGEDLEEEVRKFSDETDFLLEEELKNYSRFPLRFSAERKWRIYKMIKTMAREAPSLKEMGIVPSVKDTAWMLGSVC